MTTIPHGRPFYEQSPLTRLWLGGLLVMMMVCIGTSRANAHTPPDSTMTRGAGARAVRFSTGTNVPNYLGGKYWLSDVSALAGGIQLKYPMFETKDNAAPPAATPTSIGCFVQYERHFASLVPSVAALSPYCAGAVSVFEESYVNPIYPTTLQYSSGVSVSLLGGAEYFIASSFSVGAQGGLRLRSVRWDRDISGAVRTTTALYFTGEVVFTLYF